MLTTRGCTLVFSYLSYPVISRGCPACPSALPLSTSWASGCRLSPYTSLALLSFPQLWKLHVSVSSWSQTSVQVCFDPFPPCDVSRPDLAGPGVPLSLSVHTLRIHSQFTSQLEGRWEADPPNLWTSGKLREWEMAKNSSQEARKTQTQRAERT